MASLEPAPPKRRTRFVLPGVGVLVVALGGIQLSRGGGPPSGTFPPTVPARASTLEALGDLAEGRVLGPFQVSGVTEPTEGAILVHASSPTAEVTYEVRLASDTPLPAARGGRYAVFYRDSDGGSDVMAGAAALGALLQRAPRDAAAPPGLTPYVPAPPR